MGTCSRQDGGEGGKHLRANTKRGRRLVGERAEQGPRNKDNHRKKKGERGNVAPKGDYKASSSISRIGKRLSSHRTNNNKGGETGVRFRPEKVSEKHLSMRIGSEKSATAFYGGPCVNLGWFRGLFL